jgi:hypothetical protein
MSLYPILVWDDHPFCHCGKRAKLRTSLEEITYGRRYWVRPDDDPWFEVNSFILNFTVVCLKLPSLLSHVFSLLPPLLRWLSDVYVSPFIMTNGQRSFGARSTRGMAGRRRQDPPAITDNSVANYGIVDNPVASYALPATVEISSNIYDCYIFR